jgi:predicted regulator of Ras-like GTPase activity (Roadblock/LC7/MglB family)
MYASGHVVLGEILREQGQPGLAELQWREALKLHPEHPRAHLRLAQLCLARGEVTQALSELQFSLLFSPQSAEANSLLCATQESRRAVAAGTVARLLSELRQQRSAGAVFVVDAKGQVVDGDAGMSAKGAELAARLMAGAQPLVERLAAGPLLSVSAAGEAGELLCVAAGGRTVVAILEKGADGDAVASVAAVREAVRSGDDAD